MRLSPCRSAVLVTCVVSTLCLAAVARGQAPAVAPSASGLRDRAELEAFLDGVVAAQKDLNHFVGVTVAVVANGELFFAKGYGFADKAAGKRVDPARTLFRIGSVSKLFTWTAVMQLTEQGRLDLKADVNRYLEGSPVRVPDSYPQPITMINLLTHTPGFEDSVVGLFAKSPNTMRPLGAVLAAQLPARVRLPGDLSSYSNHGSALAGYIVERIAKVPFEEYVEKNILAPLEMGHTTVRQPVPAALAPDMSVGYWFGDGEQKAQGFEYVPARPAGAMSASAVDMAHFMLAHLQDGRYGQARILSEATARQMHTRLFGPVPDLDGMMYGFFQMNRNGHRVYGHGGDTFWFHTQLAILPDDNVGLFVSYNTDTGSAPRGAIVRAFLDRYFPAASERAVLKASKLREPAGTFEGSYRSIRMSYTTLAKLAALMSEVSVTELPDGRLRVEGVGPNPTRWVEVAPQVFRNVDSEEKIAFRRNATGVVSHLLVGFPAIAYERVGFFERPNVHYAAGGVSLALLLSAAIAWPIVAWRGRKRPRLAGPPRSAKLVAWLASAALLAFAVGLSAALDNPQEIAFGVPGSVKVLLALPIVAALLTTVGLVYIVQAWKKAYWTVAGRIYFTLVVAGAAVFLALLNYWRLLGYHY